MSKKVSPGEIGRKVEIPPDSQPVRVSGSVGIVDQPILISGQTAAGSYFPLKVVKDGSVGQLDIHGVIGTVNVGTVAIGAIAGSVHIQGTIDTINYIGSIGHVKSGSVGLLGGSVGVKSGSIGVNSLPSITGTVDIRTGSVGISGQPISIHGSVGVKEGGGRGTVDVSSLPSITGSVDIRTGSIVIKAGSVGIKGTVQTTATLAGSIGIKNGSVGVNSLPSITGTVAIKGTVQTTATMAGSVGIKNGSIGVSHLPPVTGSVDIRTGSIVVKSLPAIHGSVGIKEMAGITGSVGIKELPYTISVGSPSVTYQRVHMTQGSIGIVNFPANQQVHGTVGISGQPISIHGSVGVKEGGGRGTVEVSSLPALTGSFDIRTGSVGVSHLPPVTGSVDIRTGSIVIKAGSVGIKGTVQTTATLAGSIGIKNGSVGVNSLPSITGTVAIKGTVQTTATMAGSVGIKNGSIGVSHLPPVTGSVDIRTGSINVSNIATDYFKGTSRGSVGISHLPALTGSVDIRTGSIFDINSYNRLGTIDVDINSWNTSIYSRLGSIITKTGSVDIRTGSIVVKSIPSISGTVDIRTGSVGISGQPISIHGSVGVKEGGGRGSVAIKNQDMPFFGSTSTSLGAAASWSDTGSVSGYKNIVGYAYFTHIGSVYVKQSSGSPFDVVSSFGGTAGETIGLSVEVVAPRVEISIKNSSGTANTVRGAFYKRVI